MENESDILQESETLKKENERLKKEKADLEVLLESSGDHSDFIIDDIISELTTTKKSFLEEINKYVTEVAALKDQLSEIRHEKADLEMMMEMAADHADGVGEELLGKINSYEQQCRIITETIPIPVLITAVADGIVIYANEPASVLFGLPPEQLIGRKTTEFYDQSDRERLIQVIKEQGFFKDLEIHGQAADGSPFIAELSAKQLLFNDQNCFLSIWHDVTARKQAEEEIRKLHKEIEDAKERESKYLIFRLAGNEYGIDLLSVVEIVAQQPITPVPETPVFIKGVINLRNRLIPVADLRTVFGYDKPCDSKTSCIIITDSGDASFGVSVDSVSEVLSIKNKDIVPPPAAGLNADVSFITGMAKIGKDIKILIDIRKMYSNF